MRILNTYFLAIFFLGSITSSVSVFANDLANKMEYENGLSIAMLPDTTCGLTDTIFQVNSISCHGAADATAMIEIQGDSMLSWTIEWDNGSSGALGTNLAAGKHFVTVTTADSCMLIDSIIIADKASLAYTLTTNNALCGGLNNGSASIMDTLNYDIRWSTGDSLATLNDLAAGMYVVTVSDTTGCMAVDSFIIGVDTSAHLEVTSMNATCIGIDNGSISINDTLNLMGYTYRWSTGDSTQMITGLAPAANYMVTVTNAEGCVDSALIPLGTERQLSIDITVVNATCNGVNDGSITVNDTSDVTGFRFGWSTGDSTQTVNNLSSGAYTVVVADTMNCLAAATIAVGNTKTVTFDASIQNASCEMANNGSISINDTSDVSTLSFNWSTGDTTQMLHNLSMGGYRITVTESDGCFTTDSLTIGITETLTFTNTVKDASCMGVNDGSIIINDTTSIAGLTFAWNTGDTTQEINALAPGNYNVVVTDSFNCTAADSFMVNMGSGFSIDLTVNPAMCTGVDDGSIIINDTTSITGLTFVWSTGDSTQSIANLGAGDYGVTVTDSIGCQVDSMVTLNAGAGPRIIVAKTDESCAGLMDGAISINDTLDNTGLTFVWSTGDSTRMLSNLSDGNYTLTVTDSLGCTSTQIIEVSALSTLDINLAKTDVSCNGLDDGAISVNQGNDVSSLTINWSTGDTTQSISNLGVGTYFITVSDTANCSVMDSVQIEADSSLQLNLTGNRISCIDGNDGRVNAAVIGRSSNDGLTFIWNTGDTTATINNLVKGIYEVTITDTTSCMGSGSVTLEEGDSININFVISELACMDTMGTGAILANPSGGAGNFTYAWNTGDSTNSLINLMAGTYIVTVTDSLACTYVDSVMLTVPPSLNAAASVTQQATCNGTADGSAMVNVMGGTSPFNILWSNGENTAAIDSLNPGTYTVTVSDEAGCEVTDTVLIEETTKLLINITQVKPASSGTALDGVATGTGSGGMSPYIYDWDNGATGETVSNLGAGVHTVTVTDANGCSDTASVEIEFFDLVINIIDVRDLSCNGDNRGSATAAPANGTAPFIYSWDNGDTTATSNNLAGGTYTVIVTDSTNRKGIASVTIMEPEPIRFNLEITPPGCANTPSGRIVINATGTVGTPLYDFGVGFTTDPVILGVTVGQKNYAILDGNGCRADTSFVIESLLPNVPAPSFNVESLGLIATFENTTEDVPSDYLWKFGDSTTSTLKNPVHEYPDTGNYEVCLLVSNDCGMDSICQIIRIDPIPVSGVELTFGRDTSSLSGQIVQIPVSVGAFENVAGISGTFELSNPNIGTIQNVNALNLSGLVTEDIDIQPNLISIDWDVADTSQMVSLASGTVIFVIDLLLTGNSNECTEIIPTNTSLNLEFTKVFMGQLVAAPFTINSAEICVAPTVSITGNISREESIPIAGVNVHTDTTSFTTMSDGNYTLGGLSGGATFNVVPEKDTDPLEGITTFDIVRILQHILTRQPLPSPYKIIAADIDNTETVTSLDLIHLQRLILEHTTEFPDNKPWRFVAEAYNFSNPTRPFSENFPEAIELAKLETDTTNIDFVAIKVGDVVSDANSQNARFLQKNIDFKIQEQTFKAGDIIRVPFRMDAQKEVLGFQFELDFDHKKMTFSKVNQSNYLNINAANIGTKKLEYGRLKMLWINHQQIPIRPLAKGLFELEFVALADGQLSDILHFVQEDFVPQFYSNQNNKIGLQGLDLKIENALPNLEPDTKTPQNPSIYAFNAGEDDNPIEGCSDGIDNDGDGLIDCADADCHCACNMPAPTGNLIVNGNAEAPINSGAWIMTQGTWTTRGSNPSPQDSAAYFYPANSAMGQLTQVIDLSADSSLISQGLISYAFSGYTRSFDQEPSDQARILIEYRNSANEVLGSFDTGMLASLEDWQLITDTTLAPMGTEIAVINLFAERRNGNNNDAYFDNLSLIKVIQDDCVDPCENLTFIGISSPSIPNGEGGEIMTTITGNTGALSYNWSNGDTTANLMDVPAGSYTVTINDSIGCTLMDSVEVIADSSFFITLTGNNPTCSGDMNGMITVAITGGDAPYTYTWNDTTLMGDTLMNLAMGMYALTVTDSTGLMVSSSIHLETGSNISLNRDSSKIVAENCPGTNDGRLSLVAEGGMAPYTFIINNDTTENGVYTGLSARTYIVEISDSTGCAITDSVVVENTYLGTLSAVFTANVNDLSVALTSEIQDTTATYAWTFGNGNTDTTANPTVTYAGAGTHEICLSVTNECGTEMTCQTITVGVTGPVTFVVNDLNGTANDTVYVPVTVENFVNVVSYQKSLVLPDTAIARFLGIANMNLPNLTADNFYTVNDHTITNVWFDPSAIGQSLPNNTVIYDLMIMVNSTVDTCISIQIGETPVPIQVGGIAEGAVATVPHVTRNGEICTRETAEITGNIARETGSAVPGVQIGLTNIDITPTTNGEGDYLVEKVILGNDYELTPSLNTPLLQSVSTFDIVLINRHILGNSLLDSPYKMIAADVNKSGSITVFDLLLTQRAILGLNTEFPNNQAWRFIPKSYVFTDPSNPFAEDFPESLILEDIAQNVENQDFIAIKIADVSYSIANNNVTAPIARSNQALKLKTKVQDFAAGETIEIPITAADMEWIAGFQLELDFDVNSLELVEVKAANFPNFNANNIGLKYLQQGKIQMIWVAPEQALTDIESTLFTLKFKAKTVGNTQSALQLGNRILTSEAYSNDLEIANVELVYETTTSAAIQAFTVYPNPSTGNIEAIFDNPTAEAVDLQLFSLTGQLMTELKGIKTNTVNIDLNNFSDGTYLLMLKRANEVEVKRVVLSR